MLEVRDVVKRFGSFTAVDGVSLTVEAGEFFTLLGPSGCGKSTLLRVIAGFEQPDAGSLRLDGQDLAGVPPERRPIHTVFQSYALFPHLSVERNVAFPLEMARVPADQRRRRVAQALEEVQLAEFARHMPHELSGGQRQRVAIARALVDRPRLLLLDEPLGALDAKLREQMKLELIALQRDLGIGFVYVTHDQAEALALSRRIAVMNHGRLVQVGDPQTIYGAPANRFVADFIGRCNLLEAQAVQAGPDGLVVDVTGLGRCVLPAIASPLGTANAVARGWLALRPESLRLRTPAADSGGAESEPAREGPWAGRLVDVVYEGDVTLCRVALDGDAVVHAMVPNADPAAPPPEPGRAVVVDWPRSAGHFVPA